MNDAWEALESCWEEFEAIRAEPPGTFLQKDDIIRFADGWVGSHDKTGSHACRLRSTSLHLIAAHLHVRGAQRHPRIFGT
jgi:hypothetical protein